MGCFIEFVIMVVCAVFAFTFVFKWYRLLYKQWPQSRIRKVKNVFSLLPVLSFGLILFTLLTLASFDVVDNLYYIFFYCAMGFAWVYVGLIFTSWLSDQSWIDDAINNNNIGAAFSIFGSYLGLMLLYCGTNIGDGPGWWCVVFTLVLGATAWFLLVFALNKLARVSERITTERDKACGIRNGFLLIALGIILGKACSGDWTSFLDTVIEFWVASLAVLLTLIAVVVERFYISKSNDPSSQGESSEIGSVAWGIIYVGAAVASVLYLIPIMEGAF